MAQISLTGKLVGQVGLKCDANLIYEKFRYKTAEMSKISPDKLQEISLHEGKWGAVGSHVVWKFILDGKVEYSREMIEAIDEENKTITYKVVDGCLSELYKDLRYFIQFDNKNSNNMVKITLEYQKLSEDVPDPNSLMDFCFAVFKEADAYYA